LPEIEYVTLANHAESINGLLYLQGAGLTDLAANVMPTGQLASVHLGIGLSILVGWNETNIVYPLQFAMLHEDGGDPVFAGEGQIESGRPPGTPAGGELRSVIAIGADVVFPRPGGYRFEATLAGETKAVSLRVHANRPPVAGGFGPTAVNLPPL
jgi:hypothetical protein